MQKARAIWEEWQQTCDISKLVFLDETGTTTDLARVYGRSLAGTRLVDHVPGGHGNTMTFIAGLRMDRLIAPWCLDGAMSGEAFKTYLATQLASTLQPGDIVICDNLACHKVAGVQEIIDATGATIRYLPPYSPDLNPIEQVFAKLKALLRKAMARSFDRLWKTIGQLIPLFTKQECQNYFSHAGYKYN